MLMVTRYSKRCSHCSGRPLQCTILLAITKRGKPNPLRVNPGGTLREDIKRIIQNSRKKKGGGRGGGGGGLGGSSSEEAYKGSRAWRLTIRGRRRRSAWIKASCTP